MSPKYIYRAVELAEPDGDFHRFVWRPNPKDVLGDRRMMWVTFGVSASCFAANMVVKQIAIDFVDYYPMAAKVVETSLYIC